LTPGRDVLKDSLAAYLLVIYSGLAMVEPYLQGSPTFLCVYMELFLLYEKLDHNITVIYTGSISPTLWRSGAPAVYESMSRV